MMQILGLLGMYFDAAVEFVTNSSLLFRLAMAILWYNFQIPNKEHTYERPLLFWKNILTLWSYWKFFCFYIQ